MRTAGCPCAPAARYTPARARGGRRPGARGGGEDGGRRFHAFVGVPVPAPITCEGSHARARWRRRSARRGRCGRGWRWRRPARARAHASVLRAWCESKSSSRVARLSYIRWGGARRPSSEERVYNPWYNRAVCSLGVTRRRTTRAREPRSPARSSKFAGPHARARERESARAERPRP